MRQIDLQLHNLLSIRAMFPYLAKDLIGITSYPTAPLYQDRGFNITFSFSEPLTAERVEEINTIGHWVNQNFIVRLCALLESHHIIPPKGKGKINQQLDGHEEVDILRRLRNVIAHTSGRYDPKEPNERKLYERIAQKFSIEADDPQTTSDFPLPIDTLLIPLAEGCKRYTQALTECERRG
jgi:hypothetical protein